MSNDVTVKASFSLSPTSLEEALKLAELMAKSDLVPKDYQGKPGNVLIAVQMGAEVGLSPMQAIQSIAVINGRPALWGDGLLAVVQSHPDYEWHDESGSDETQGVCIIKRKGHQPHTSIFTLADAQRAGLVGKPGPWSAYTKRMLMMRARSYAVRDKFSDAIKGMIPAEEAIDITPVEDDQAAPSVPIPTLKDKLKAQAATVSQPAPQEVETVPEPPAPTLPPLEGKAPEDGMTDAEYDANQDRVKYWGNLIGQAATFRAMTEVIRAAEEEHKQPGTALLDTGITAIRAQYWRRKEVMGWKTTKEKAAAQAAVSER